MEKTLFIGPIGCLGKKLRRHKEATRPVTNSSPSLIEPFCFIPKEAEEAVQDRLDYSEVGHRSGVSL